VSRFSRIAEHSNGTVAVTRMPFSSAIVRVVESSITTSHPYTAHRKDSTFSAVLAVDNESVDVVGERPGIIGLTRTMNAYPISLKHCANDRHFVNGRVQFPLDAVWDVDRAPVGKKTQDA
jgi:hypothetical protein